MIERMNINPCAPTATWMELADKVLQGETLSRDEARQVLNCPDEELLELMAAVFRVRRKWFGQRVQLYMLMNAKSGLCPEDCSYCSQSKISDAEIPRYNLLNRTKLLDGARVAAERGATTYCIVISAKGPNEREIQAVEQIVPEIKQQYGLKVCACLGLLSPDQAQRLAAAGVDRVNHNLNTSENHYPHICTTHTYADRVATLAAVRQSGMEVCSGGIMGMGETDEDIIDLAFALRAQDVQSLPINFLNPIEGTPLSGQNQLHPRRCLKMLALFRLVNPQSELRIGGGREMHLRSLQPLGLYAANSIFVGD